MESYLFVCESTISRHKKYFFTTSQCIARKRALTYLTKAERKGTESEMKRLITSVTPKAGNSGSKGAKTKGAKDDLKAIDPSLDSPGSTFRTWRPLQKKTNKYEIEGSSTGCTQDTEDETIRESDTLATDFRHLRDSNTYESDDISAHFFDDETSLTDCSLSTMNSCSSQSCISDDLSECSNNSLLENAMPMNTHLKAKRNKNVKEEEKELKSKHEEACKALKVNDLDLFCVFIFKKDILTLFK